jgi:hypothetical protein
MVKSVSLSHALETSRSAMALVCAYSARNLLGMGRSSSVRPQMSAPVKRVEGRRRKDEFRDLVFATAVNDVNIARVIDCLTCCGTCWNAASTAFLLVKSPSVPERTGPRDFLFWILVNLGKAFFQYSIWWQEIKAQNGRTPSFEQQFHQSSTAQTARARHVCYASWDALKPCRQGICCACATSKAKHHDCYYCF